jgi:hypothetical protein
VSLGSFHHRPTFEIVVSTATVTKDMFRDTIHRSCTVFGHDQFVGVRTAVPISLDEFDHVMAHEPIDVVGQVKTRLHNTSNMQGKDLSRIWILPGADVKRTALKIVCNNN